MEAIKKILSIHPNKTITLPQMQKFMTPYFNTYEEFSKAVLQLEAEEVLTMVKSKGRTSRTPSLALQYRIDKSLLSAHHHKELQYFRNILHTSISLDDYYRKDPSIWQFDLPFIQKIDDYIKTHGFPLEPVPAPERSFELVGDEKWLTEKDGKELLERVGLFERMMIIPVSEPLMFAIHPNKINCDVQLHLIVENKTTYQGLLPALCETEFSTLIYGCGKSVIKCIEQFSLQYPVEADHHFFYFGDLDREGILIWHLLNKRREVALALPFYRACLNKPQVKGKGYQREQVDAQELFLTYFSRDEQTAICDLLGEGMYYPQETLKTRELQTIWRDSDWRVLM
jgi:hypothetical protein